MAAPFLLITGDNPSEREFQETQALHAWLGEDAGHLGRQIFQGTETDPDALLASLTPSLFAAKSAVVVRAAQECPAAAVEILNVSLPAALESDIAVLIVGEKGPNASTKAGKAFARMAKELGRAIACPSPKVQELPGWVVRHAKERLGLTIERPAAELLVERAGTTDFRAVGEVLGDLEQELEKLSLGLGKGEPITVKRVDEMVGDRRPVSLQDLQAALLHRHPSAAVDAWQRLRHEGIPAFLLAQTCFGDFLMAYRLRHAIDRGMSSREAAAELKLNAWVMEKRGLEAAARGRSVERWRRDLLSLCRIEAVEKRGGFPFDYQLDLEFYQLAR